MEATAERTIHGMADPKDERLAGWIRDELLRDARVSEHSIGVAVKDGLVTLQGTVQSYRRKLVAQEIAASYEGCRGVVNELQVRPPGRLSDTEIAGHVRATLDAHADITKAAITVTVKEGEVTLAGNVANHAEHTLVVDLVMSVRGVRSAYDVLIVDLQQQIDDQTLSRKIEAELARTRGLQGANIKVAANGGTAVLSGRIAQLWQKEMAEVVARRFPLRAVRNDIIVGGQDGIVLAEL